MRTARSISINGSVPGLGHTLPECGVLREQRSNHDIIICFERKYDFLDIHFGEVKGSPHSMGRLVRDPSFASRID